jgi:large subunit ribosomal protein L9
MKVILKRDVKGLGHTGDVKDVKNGYARNFLFPTGAAALADAGALKNWERHRTEREEREQGIRSEAEAIAQRLRELKLEVAVKAGEKNRLFGSVTNREIADLIAQEGIEVDRHAVHLREPIKTLGDFKVDVHLMAGVDAEMTVSVVALQPATG